MASRYHPGSRRTASTSVLRERSDWLDSLAWDNGRVSRLAYLAALWQPFGLRLRKDFWPLGLPRLTPFPGSLPAWQGLLVSINAFVGRIMP